MSPAVASYKPTSRIGHGVAFGTLELSDRGLQSITGRCGNSGMTG